MARGKNAPEMFEAFHRMGKVAQSPETKPAEDTEPRGETRRLTPPPPDQPVFGPQANRPSAQSSSVSSASTESGTREVRAARPPGMSGPMTDPTAGAHVFPLGATPEVVLAFSYTALGIAAGVLILAAILVGFVGYRIGQHSPALAQATTPGAPAGNNDNVAKGGLGVVMPGENHATNTGNGDNGDGVRPTVRMWSVMLIQLPNSRRSRDSLEKVKETLTSQGVPDVAVNVKSDGSMVALFAGQFEDKAQADRLAARMRRTKYQGRDEFKTAYVTYYDK